jgi:hypothetical protein
MLTEKVNVERMSGGVWTVIARSVPATFENVMPTTRQKLETWTHKPLFMLWLSPVTSFADGDRVIRSDGTRWYMRGAPMAAPLNTHVVALIEGSAEDGLFAARNASEPS